MVEKFANVWRCSDSDWQSNWQVAHDTQGACEEAVLEAYKQGRYNIFHEQLDVLGKSLNEVVYRLPQGVLRDGDVIVDGEVIHVWDGARGFLFALN